MTKNQLESLSKGVTAETGSSLLGNLAANVVANVGGALVGGGTAGAATATNVDLYNRQLDTKEKSLAQQLSDASGGKYTVAQIEDQMRQMDMSVNGTTTSGAPATLVGQTPTDSGAQWMSAGTTANGQPVLTQILAPSDAALQSYILANYNSISPGQMPNEFTYPSGSRDGSINVTGPFTSFGQSDANFVRNTTADAASMISTNVGRIGAAAATAAALPTPYAPVFEGIAFGSTVTGWVADFVVQTARPNPGSYVAGAVVDLPLGGVANKYPLAGTVITESGSWIKNTTTFNDVSSQLNNAVQNKK
ncbi:hypothetical protein [Paraburkholderia sp. Cpub6]|uniref:hypothetical protein n=1 Tax=Paraburkholderia sp. Cpub6 TaxID=2723094 RepID=UPI00160822EC|nr:hypothetical protein [Paraburkholderia sp. Cpub6]MBB5457803.1 filamentous hemagglutinin [Paraburkholderia sp. Cpub6]